MKDPLDLVRDDIEGLTNICETILDTLDDQMEVNEKFLERLDKIEKDGELIGSTCECLVADMTEEKDLTESMTDRVDFIWSELQETSKTAINAMNCIKITVPNIRDIERAIEKLQGKEPSIQRKLNKEL